MLAFARLQLRDEHRAEDVVQEALVSALSHQTQFRAEAEWQTWIFAILKNKIIDALRHIKREHWQDADMQESQIDAEQSALFYRGNWLQGRQPAEWGDPQQYIHQQDFMKILQLCLDCLPANTARIFLMKEVMEFSISEIVECTGLSAENCHTIMYRARNGLRACLQKNWFNQTTQENNQ